MENSHISQELSEGLVRIHCWRFLYRCRFLLWDDSQLWYEAARKAVRGCGLACSGVNCESTGRRLSLGSSWTSGRAAGFQILMCLPIVHELRENDRLLPRPGPSLGSSQAREGGTPACLPGPSVSHTLGTRHPWEEQLQRSCEGTQALPCPQLSR